MSTPFKAVHHLCVVVRDIDKAVAFYESIGIGPWTDYPPLSQYTELDVPSVSGFLELRFKYAPLGQLQLQLAQPGEGDSLQRRFLDTHGEGVFSVGFVVDDADAAEADAIALGLEVAMRGRRPNTSGFTYYATAAGGGVVLMTRQSPPVG
jgi:methylmalonyl-CoA/ethylmalonyl-CoA epimerase